MWQDLGNENNDADQEQPDFNGLPLDRATVAQALLDIDNKQRSNLLPWNGQFSPQLIEVLLRSYAPKYGLVLDPFAGSGTVLCEAGRLAMPVVGSEINPAACKIAQLYRLINVPVTDRKTVTTRLETALEDFLPENKLSLFSTSRKGGRKCVKEALVEMHAELEDLAAQSLVESLIVLLDFRKDVTVERVYSTWAKLKTRVLSLPLSDSPIRLLNCDARRLPLRDGEAGFVVTSPPYINVFNYHQQYRESVEALGWNLLRIAQSEIGSNRKHRQNRFLTVIQYCLDMTDALREIQRVCKEGSRVIMIVGRESNVRKTRFFNGEIMAALASQCVGFSLVARQERVFTNRFGERISEDLLHFNVERRIANLIEPKEIAREVLGKAKMRAPGESLGDLEDALAFLEQVNASPIYEQTAAFSSGGRQEKGANP